MYRRDATAAHDKITAVDVAVVVGDVWLATATVASVVQDIPLSPGWRQFSVAIETESSAGNRRLVVLEQQSSPKLVIAVNRYDTLGRRAGVEHVLNGMPIATATAADEHGVTGKMNARKYESHRK